MSALSRRVRHNLEDAIVEIGNLQVENTGLATANQQLWKENARLTHENRLAYLEGVDQGRAMAGMEVAS